MRRMPTTKELKYVDELSQVAEKGFKVGTYPASIESYGEAEISWPDIQAQILEGERIDFENHIFAAYMIFTIPSLLIHYGLSESGDDVPYIGYDVSDGITMPNSVVDFESLKAWMQSQTFISGLEGVGYYVDESFILNEVANYSVEDPVDNIILLNGKLTLDTVLTCTQGEGEEIEGASDPIGVDTLKVENLEVENIISENIKTWYFIQGNFTGSDDVRYNIITKRAFLNSSNKYVCEAIAWESNSFNGIKDISIDFDTQKIYDGNTEISLDTGWIEMVDALNGNTIKEIDV